MAKKKKKKNDNSYTIEDQYFGLLKVKHTANAWWKDKEKVTKLITGYKMDCKPAELRLLTGVTKRKMEYFLDEHPEFCAIFEDFRKVPTLKARATVVKAVVTDANHAFKYLERKEPDEFKERKDVTTNDEPLNIIQDVI